MTSSFSRRNRFPQSKWRQFFSLGKIHLFKFVKSTYIHYTYLIWFVADNISFLVYIRIYVVCALQHHHILLFQRYDVFLDASFYVFGLFCWTGLWKFFHTFLFTVYRSWKVICNQNAVNLCWKDTQKTWSKSKLPKSDHCCSNWKGCINYW